MPPRVKKTPTAAAAAPKPAKSTRARRATEKGKVHQAAVKKAAKKNQAAYDDETGDETDDPDVVVLDTQEGAGKPDKTLSFDWSDQTLSEALLTRVYEDRGIKRALYPPPGPNASTANGGGKTKTAAHWQLCLNLFSEHPKYATALAAVTTAKERTAYANKIKNRLRAMARITRAFMAEMGETGAGIRSADEIDMSLSNAFTTKWQEILPVAPWFFEMRELIAQRPNLVPTGLGHSGSGFDADVLGTGVAATDDAADNSESSPEDLAVQADISSDSELEGRTLSEIHHDTDDFPDPNELTGLIGTDADYRPSDDPAFLADNDDDDSVEDEQGKKRKKATNGKARGKTAALPGTSTPAAAPVPNTATKSAKKSKVVEFAEIAKTEELTRQKELELATIRAKHTLKTLDVKAALEHKREERKREDRQARREERRAKLRMREMRLQQTHELRMAQFLAGSRSHAAGFSDPALHVDSPAHSHTSSEAQYSLANSDYSTAGAGPSSGSSFDIDTQYQLPPFPSYP